MDLEQKYNIGKKGKEGRVNRIKKVGVFNTLFFMSCDIISSGCRKGPHNQISL